MKRRHRHRLLWVLAILLLWFGQRILFPITTVEHQSMWPAFEGGRDRVLLQRGCERAERFEPVVFRARSGQLALKRAVAFRGEHIDLDGGDLWIGRDRENLRRAHRPPEMRRAMRVPLHPERGTWRRESGDALPRPPASWSGSEGREDTAWLVVGGSRDLMDDSRRVDGGWIRGRHAVPDLVLDIAVASLKPGARLVFGHRYASPEASRWVEFREEELVLGRGARLEGRGVEIARWPRTGPPLELRLETCDGEFRLLRLVEGQVADVLYARARDTRACGGVSRVFVTVSGGAATLSRLAVQRDVHYFWTSDPRGPAPGPYFIGRGMFLLGDNPAVSRDSRELGPLSVDRIWGRARIIVWPRSRVRLLF